MDKEIIINGVDVSKCEYLNTFSDCDGYHDYCELADNIENQYCKHYTNCYYKQLTRKTAKCEELKEKQNILKGAYIKRLKEWYHLKQALDEIELSVTNLISSCNKCEDNKNGYCIGIDECSSKCFKKLLDIINKAKDGNNE